MRGKTAVEQSSQAFTQDTAADSSAAQTPSSAAQTPPQAGAGREPLKLGTTAAEHASSRNASPTGINSPSAGAIAGPFASTGVGSGASGGQAGPRLGTTAFEHALSRTSGTPLGRSSGTFSSPPTSFKGPSGGARDPASDAEQGTLNKTYARHPTLVVSAAALCLSTSERSVLLQVPVSHRHVQATTRHNKEDAAGRDFTEAHDLFKLPCDASQYKGWGAGGGVLRSTALLVAPARQ